MLAAFPGLAGRTYRADRAGLSSRACWSGRAHLTALPSGSRLPAITGIARQPYQSALAWRPELPAFALRARGAYGPRWPFGTINPRITTNSGFPFFAALPAFAW